MSPADDRHRLSPTGLRDGGRDDYDDEDEEEIPTPRRARDAAADVRADARARSATSDSGVASSSRPRDAAARVDAEIDPVGVNTSAPPLIPNTPISAPVADPSTPARGSTTTDRAIADREGASRDAEGRDDDDSDERPSTSTSRTRDGSGSSAASPPREVPPPSTRDRSGRVAAPQCRYSWDCPASACELTEFACCNEGACGCKGGFFATCRRS